MNVAVNAGEYAWKPVIVADVVERARAEDRPSDVLWADAGCYFHALQPIADRIAETGGLWVRTSAGTMRQWTHPLMFEFLKADPNEYGDKANADATLVGFATGSAPASAREAVYRDIVLPWKACAMARTASRRRGRRARTTGRIRRCCRISSIARDIGLPTTRQTNWASGASATGGSITTSGSTSRPASMPEPVSRDGLASSDGVGARATQ